jgi:glycerol uptake facilitator-like aquaporin
MRARALAGELLGTAGLLLAVVGSGITASIDGPASAQLFQHAIVVGAALAAFIVTFGPVSGAHFNPAVTLVDAAFGGMRAGMATAYIAAQLVGAVIGVVGANLLFGEPAVALGTNERTGALLGASEAVATFGLLMVIFGVVRSSNPRAAPVAVGAYVAAAISFTSSAAFANPAVTVARALTDTYSGIAPSSVPGFLAAQLLGAALAAAMIGWLFRIDADTAEDVVVSRDEEIARS